ncbi:MAG TPA: plasmid pRiA4b ORF-3 family protein [Xanthobacteraceae bacterium]|nr:plasmid pRiA4b ORF-3 family protein [Xanthobacteraceae bacterium]
MAENIARLRVAIDEVTPAVVRRVEVPLDIRLDDLHFVLQIAVGWQNCHPFEFRLDGAEEKRWGLVDRDDPDSSPLPAESATLADLLAHGREPFHYDYVYGEDWTHTVEVETVASAAPGIKYPLLVSAQGRCPPADIGGTMGYETFLHAIADPLHLNHEGMREWDDADFDPHVVDEAAIRANLANLGKYLGRRKAKG